MTPRTLGASAGFRITPRPLDALDRVDRLDEDRIIAVKAVSGSEPYFQGHYPGHPIYPGVFILEAVHQAAHHFAQRRLGVVPRLSEIRSIRFVAPLQPGDCLESDCRCRLAPDRACLTVEATCTSGGHTCAQVKLTYQIRSDT